MGAASVNKAECKQLVEELEEKVIYLSLNINHKLCLKTKAVYSIFGVYRFVLLFPSDLK